MRKSIKKLTALAAGVFTACSIAISGCGSDAAVSEAVIDDMAEIKESEDDAVADVTDAVADAVSEVKDAGTDHVTEADDSGSTEQEKASAGAGTSHSESDGTTADIEINNENSVDRNSDKSERREILKFVDVFGVEYETEIIESVPKIQYDKSLFVHDGNSLTYDDDNYTSRLGIDVSHHQGEIDWKKVKEAGYDFAFLRIGYRGYGKEGLIKADRMFDANIKAAHEAGLDVGVYFFSQAISDEEAAEEANFVIEHLKDYDLELPVVYDPESILDDVARTDDVTPEQFTGNSMVFCKTIADAGYVPMIYSNMLWEAFELDMETVSQYPFWYADYEPLPQTPYSFEFWQYTNTAKVPGISGEADLDIQMIKKSVSFPQAGI